VKGLLINLFKYHGMMTNIVKLIEFNRLWLEFVLNPDYCLGSLTDSKLTQCALYLFVEDSKCPPE